MEQSAGNDILFLPEVTNCISSDLKHLSRVVDSYEANPFIAAVSEKAGELGIWVALGSIVIKSNEADGHYNNRSLLINSESFSLSLTIVILEIPPILRKQTGNLIECCKLIK